MAIIVAGATVNIIFALTIYFFISTSTNIYYGTTLNSISNDTAEYASGLRSGDEIVKVNNKKVLVGYDIQKIIENSKTDDFNFEVKRNDDIKKNKC